jgi:hypothetical protein
MSCQHIGICEVKCMILSPFLAYFGFLKVMLLLHATIKKHLYDIHVREIEMVDEVTHFSSFLY